MEKNNFSYNGLITPNQTFDYCNGDRSSTVLSATRNYTHGVRNYTKHNFDSSISNSSSPIDGSSRNSSLRSPRLLFSEDEEEELSISLKEYYDKDLSALLKTSFESKKYCFDVRGAKLPSPDTLFIEEKWHVSIVPMYFHFVRLFSTCRFSNYFLFAQNEKLPELQSIKHDLNAVKSKLNEYELTQWHKHTRSMNPADKVMRHLRRDVKVEFLTQVNTFPIPRFYNFIKIFATFPYHYFLSTGMV